MSRENNVIIGGSGGKIEYSEYCTIIGGNGNTISSRYNTHIIGTMNVNMVDNALYIGCENGVFCDGDIRCDISLSDERLKNNITVMHDGLNKVMKIDPVEFDWNDKQKTYIGHDIGVIAQQVQEVAPEIVETRDNGFLAVNYKKLIPLALDAIKNQDKRISELEKKLGIID